MSTEKIKSKGFWSKAFISISVINFAMFIGFHMLNSTFTLYIKDLGGSEALAGVVAGMFSVASVLVRPVAGWLLDNVGRRSILLLSLAVMSVFNLSFAFISVLSLAIIIRLCQGIVWSASSTAPNTAVCDIIPPERFGEAMGIFATGPALSMAVGPLLGLTLWQSAGSQGLFILAAGFGIFAYLLAVFAYKTKENRQPQKGSAEKIVIKDLIDNQALPASVTQLLFNMPHGAIASFIAVYAISSGIGSGAVFFCLMALTTILTRLFLGKIADKKGRDGAVIIGGLTLVISMILLFVGKSTTAFFLAALIYGIGFGIIPPIMQAMAMRFAVPERRGAASSTYLCSFDIGIGLGSAVSGFLIKFIGYNAMFLVMSIFVIIAIAAFCFWARQSISKSA